MNLELICNERDKPRKQHEIYADISEICNHSEYPTLWQLINELENSAWVSGLEEAMDWKEAFEQDPYAQ